MIERDKPTLDVSDYDCDENQPPPPKRPAQRNLPRGVVLLIRALEAHTDHQYRSDLDREPLLRNAYNAIRRGGVPSEASRKSPTRQNIAERLARRDPSPERPWVNLISEGNEETTQSLEMGLSFIDGGRIIRGGRNVVRPDDPFMVGFFDRQGDDLLTLAKMFTGIPKDGMTLYFLDKGGTHQIYDSVAFQQRAYPFYRLRELYDREKHEEMHSAREKSRVHFARVKALVDGHEKNILDLIYHPPKQINAVSLERFGEECSNSPIPNLPGTIEITWLGRPRKKPWIRQALREIYSRSARVV